MAGRARPADRPAADRDGSGTDLPWEQAQRLADEAGGEAELLLLADGNHGCANLPQHHRPYTADWMAASCRLSRPAALAHRARAGTDARGRTRRPGPDEAPGAG